MKTRLAAVIGAALGHLPGVLDFACNTSAGHIQREHRVGNTLELRLPQQDVATHRALKRPLSSSSTRAMPLSAKRCMSGADRLMWPKHTTALRWCKGTRSRVSRSSSTRRVSLSRRR